jgi:hypothetical protein
VFEGSLLWNRWKMINILSSSAIRGALSALAPSRILTSQPVTRSLLPTRKSLLAPTKSLLELPHRHSGTFFNHRPAQELWKCVTTVSNQGRQRGRAKGLVKIKNLHRGQKLGFGPARISFPGQLFFSDSSQRSLILLLKRAIYSQ